MDIWYAHLSEETLLDAVRSAAAEASKSKKTAKEAMGGEKRVQKGRGSPHPRQPAGAVQARRGRLGSLSDRQSAAIMVPVRNLAAIYGLSPDQAEGNVHAQFRA